MTERSRTVLIALGVSILVVAIAPLLVCLGGMMGMGGTEGMADMMGGDSSGTMMSARPMIAGGLVLVALIVGGIVSLVLGLRRG